MKKLLVLPLLLISCFCLAQNATEIIGKPVKIGNLLVAENAFPDEMNWVDAKKACVSLGKGWRLPNKKELDMLYINRFDIGGFMRQFYWTSTGKNNMDAWKQSFNNGVQITSTLNDATCFVRAVKSN
jgi:hypothetical protein